MLVDIRGGDGEGGGERAARGGGSVGVCGKNKNYTFGAMKIFFFDVYVTKSAQRHLHMKKAKKKALILFCGLNNRFMCPRSNGHMVDSACQYIFGGFFKNIFDL